MWISFVAGKTSFNTTRKLIILFPLFLQQIFSLFNDTDG